MRKTITVALTSLALALPVADAWAAATASTAKPKAKKKVVTTTKRFTGPAAQTHEWGTTQVTIVVKKTTTTVGTKKNVVRKITGVTATYPDHTDRSVRINQQAIPILYQETLRAQSANIQMVSGASDTSQAFAQSLQSALMAAVRV
jgi:uncharacterized protein with FMN-binding domain